MVSPSSAGKLSCVGVPLIGTMDDTIAKAPFGIVSEKVPSGTSPTKVMVVATGDLMKPPSPGFSVTAEASGVQPGTVASYTEAEYPRPEKYFSNTVPSCGVGRTFGSVLSGVLKSGSAINA